MRKKIATPVINASLAKVYVTEGTGGTFTLFPDSGLPVIEIGIGYEHWWRVQEVAIHELQEMVMATMQLRYEKTGRATEAADRFFFLMNHADFADVASKTAYALETIRKPLKKAWKKHHQKPEAPAKEAEPDLDYFLREADTTAEAISLEMIDKLGKSVPDNGSERDLTIMVSEHVWQAWNRYTGDPPETRPTDWLGAGMTSRIYGAETIIAPEFNGLRYEIAQP